MTSDLVEKAVETATTVVTETRLQPDQKLTPQGKTSPVDVAWTLAVLLAMTALARLVVLGIQTLGRAWRAHWRREGRWTTLYLAWDAWRATHDGPPDIATRQKARLADLVAAARACSPYYRALYRQLPTHVSDVRQLPPVTKSDLMAHFDDWVADPTVTRASVEAFVADPSMIGQSYLGRYLVFTTSGSTGVPALLVQDHPSLAVYDALRFVRAALVGLTPIILLEIISRGIRSAALYATDGHFGGASLAAWVRRTRPWVVRRLRVFSVRAPLPDLVREMNAFQPALVVGYATALSLLAQEQQAGRLRIHPVLVISTAETLTPTMRERIASAFGSQVRNAYAASEAAAIAFECRHGRLHVNADWYILEPVDAAYQPVPPGQPSHTVLVTNLANQVQPIIRYDLGDSVTVSTDRCPCGSPLPVIRVEGRTDDILSVPTPSGQTVHLLPLALVAVVEETPGVQRFQVIQTAPTRLKVRLEVTPTAGSEEVWEAVKQRLHTYLAEQGLQKVAVERATEPPMRDPRTGKFRQVWSELKPGGQSLGNPNRVGPAP